MRPPSRARAIMVLGTMSNSGKTAFVAGLCRLLARRGVKVAPFKAQNMSLNSHVTPEGREIGRAQAMQARAAGVESHADMNPVLLKPTGHGLMQVLLGGLPYAQGGNSNRTAKEYYAERSLGHLRQEAHLAYDRLASRFEAVVLEGAGSPAEINLRDQDFVNASMAEHAAARCLLVADIDRGGVFASILGTVQLLHPRHRALLDGIVINKFRGDPDLLADGIREIEGLTGVPVLGVLPWLGDLGLEEEDSLGIPASQGMGGVRGLLDIAVLRLPHMSNFTDFLPFTPREGFHLRYVKDALDLGNPDFILLPGSKSVRLDLDFLAATGLRSALSAAAGRSIPLLGICGGYQMLGLVVEDPRGLEGPPGQTPGLGLLPVTTVMESAKELGRVTARNLGLPFLDPDAPVEGYEIHMGRTAAPEPSIPLLLVTAKNGAPCREESGTASSSLPVYGTYLHGLFDSSATRQGLREWLLRRKGLEGGGIPTSPLRDPIDAFADALETHCPSREHSRPCPGGSGAEGLKEHYPGIGEAKEHQARVDIAFMRRSTFPCHEIQAPPRCASVLGHNPSSFRPNRH